MDARFRGFGEIMQELNLGNTRDFEVWYEKYLKGKEQIKFDITGFVWDDAQIGFDYELGELYDNVTAMATYVDLNSEPLPRGRDTQLRKFGGQIPRQKRLEVLGENDYRRWMIAAEGIEGGAVLRGESPYRSLKDYFAEKLLNTVGEFPSAHAQSMTFQVGQMKSNPNGLMLTPDNNEGGLVGINFKSNIPTENVTDNFYWKEKSDGTVESYESTKNPFEDSMKFVKSLKYGGTYGAITLEIDEEETFFKLIHHPAFLKAIGYNAVAGLYTAGKTNADSDERAIEAGNHEINRLGYDSGSVKELFKRLMGVDEVIFHNNVVFAPKFNPATKKFENKMMKAFNTGVMLYRPSGTMGTIKNVVPVRPDGSAISSYIFGGRGIIEYRYNAETRTQTWVSELTALAVPSKPTKMYIKKIGDDSEVAKMNLTGGTPVATTTSKRTAKAE